MDGGMAPIEEFAEPLEAPEPESRSPRDPMRRCLVTGTVQAKTAMIRFVVGPDGSVVPDLEGRLPGRGLWLTAARAVVERAVARKGFARAARQSVTVAPGLADLLVALLERRCLDTLGLARRAGQVVAGYEKVHAALVAGRVGRLGVPGLLLGACDGAAEGRARLLTLAGGLPVVEEFEAATMGAALGRDLAVHALMAQGDLADRLRVDAGRLSGLRTRPVGQSPAGIRSTTDQSDTND
jgi:predicted RNA-binding protein YlxR (DUF448 family)